MLYVIYSKTFSHLGDILIAYYLTWQNAIESIIKTVLLFKMQKPKNFLFALGLE